MLSGVFGFEQVRHTPNVAKDCFGFTHIDFCCKRAGEKVERGWQKRKVSTKRDRVIDI